jgi:hypothetical protein
MRKEATEGSAPKRAAISTSRIIPESLLKRVPEKNFFAEEVML